MFGRDLLRSPSPTIHLPTILSTNHVSQCHIYTFLKHLQGDSSTSLGLSTSSVLLGGAEFGCVTELQEEQRLTCDSG